MTNTREQRRTIKFINPRHRNPYRKKSKKQEPIQRSKYAQQLFEIGAGWNE